MNRTGNNNLISEIEQTGAVVLNEQYIDMEVNGIPVRLGGVYGYILAPDKVKEANYKPNEPIFVSNVQLPVLAVNLRKMFKELCDSGKINCFDKGVYYIFKQSRLKGGVPLGADAVARAKYIYRNGRVEGYYSGFTFTN